MSERQAGSPSIVFYCHDGVGMGHVRRAQVLGECLHERWPAMRQLFILSTPAARLLTLPAGSDFIKLPWLDRVGDEENENAWVSPAIPRPAHVIQEIRREILLSIFRQYQPDALIVDYVPAGLKGELGPSLRMLKQNTPGTRLIYGVRDIPNESSRVRRHWSADGEYELLDSVYDSILVYGQREVYDLAEQAGLSTGTSAKVRYLGYLRRAPGRRAPEDIRTSLQLKTGRLVLITAGSGIDTHELAGLMIEAFSSWPSELQFDCLVVGGPFMPSSQRDRLQALIPAGAPIQFRESVSDLSEYIAAADVVVSRAGYNTICEILSFERPALIVPRVRLPNGAEDNQEQVLRADALKRRGLARVVHPDELTPRLLLDTVNDLLEHPPEPGDPLNLNGLPAFAAEVETILKR